MKTLSNNNGEAENETPKSSEDDENNSEESSSNNTNLVDSSNNQLINWTAEDLECIDDSEEKIYEDLCYVTISSSSFPSEVFITICYLICPTPTPFYIRKRCFFLIYRCVCSVVNDVLYAVEVEVEADCSPA